MKAYTTGLVIATCASLFISACQPRKGGKALDASGSATAQPLALKAVGNSPSFPDAQLAITNVAAGPVGKDSAKVTFGFAVKNYELKQQTADNSSKQCNNSAQGQHIHFIMDNKPYKALYEPTNDITLPVNSEHTLIAFLSRSYHESIKGKGAAVVYHFKLDANGKLQKMPEPATPKLFYSRPKGDYLGKDTANVLLDFYVMNCDLSADGYKVKAKVTNESRAGADSTFTITKWEPNFINNLGTGKASVTLTLVDKDGQTVDGPVTRNFQLAADEPMKK